MGFYDPLTDSGFMPPADDRAVVVEMTADEVDLARLAPLSDLAKSAPQHADADLSPDVMAALDPGMTPAEEVGLVLDRPDVELAAKIAEELDTWQAQYKARNDQADPPLPELLAEAMRRANRDKDLSDRPPAAIGRMAYRRSRGLFGLEQFLDDPEVADVSINSHNNVWIEKAGQLLRVSSPFLSVRDIDLLVQRIDIGQPTLKDPIRDGSFEYPLEHARREGTEPVGVRVNIVHASRAADGETSLAMRKPVSSGYDVLQTWTRVQPGMDKAPLSEQAEAFLEMCVKARVNILVVGGTGSGKTSILKGLLKLMPDDERIMAVEDSHEIVLTNPNSKGLVAVGGTTLAELIEAGMRMRPDRIIVGECRKPKEVNAFLEAINTGHDGSITTTHASSAKDGLYRLLTLACRDGDGDEKQVGQLLFSGLHLIIYLGAQKVRQPDGSTARLRRVMDIASIFDFSTATGSAQFVTQSVFGRFMSDAYGSAPDFDKIEIGQDMTCRGISGISPRLMAHLMTQGLTTEEIAAAVQVDRDANASRV